MIKNSHFKPAWWLPGPHLQTVWQTLARRKVKLHLRRERLELPDGDFLDLDFAGQGQSPIVLVLHGLGGSVESPYAKGMLQAIVASGWRAVFMHFRGCSGEFNRLAKSYHSGETGDLNFVIQELRRRESHTGIAVVGFSLGGNVLLKWLGETSEQNPLMCAVAISVPFELHKSVDRLGVGFSKFYQWWLLYRLKLDTQKKFEKISSPIDLSGIKNFRTFWEFDDQVTAPLHGFSSALEYYHQASARQYLPNIFAPTLILQSKDDPFTTEDAVPDKRELPKNVVLELSHAGGHVGFVAGYVPWRAKYWVEERVCEYISSQL